jgi:ribosomal protein RSM22 (predicted rRNA methylase)
MAVKALTRRWVANAVDGSRVVRELPSTLGRCNELAFATEAQTLAYTIWHLADRYGRLLQVLDALFVAGHLPLRRKRMSVLEVGAGPSPAIYAVTDFYIDLRAWLASQGELGVEICPVTHPMSLGRGPAWAHLVHNVSEELILLGGIRRVRPFGVTYGEFTSFSVRAEHLAGIERAARGLVYEAEAWDEHLDLPDARAEALRGHSYQPGAVDLVILCNFLTHPSMTEAFAEEIALLGDSLTPGGVLVALGSTDPTYDAIFDDLRRLVTRGGRATPISITNGPVTAHTDSRAHDVIEEQIIACLRHCENAAPSVFAEIRNGLPRQVRHPGSEHLTFPAFRVAAYKDEGVRPRGKWGRRR